MVFTRWAWLGLWSIWNTYKSEIQVYGFELAVVSIESVRLCFMFLLTFEWTYCLYTRDICIEKIIKINVKKRVPDLKTILAEVSSMIHWRLEIYYTISHCFSTGLYEHYMHIVSLHLLVYGFGLDFLTWLQSQVLPQIYFACLLFSIACVVCSLVCM